MVDAACLETQSVRDVASDDKLEGEKKKRHSYPRFGLIIQDACGGLQIKPLLMADYPLSCHEIAPFNYCSN